MIYMNNKVSNIPQGIVAYVEDRIASLEGLLAQDDLDAKKCMAYLRHMEILLGYLDIDYPTAGSRASLDYDLTNIDKIPELDLSKILKTTDFPDKEQRLRILVTLRNIQLKGIKKLLQYAHDHIDELQQNRILLEDINAAIKVSWYGFLIIESDIGTSLGGENLF